MNREGHSLAPRSGISISRSALAAYAALLVLSFIPPHAGAEPRVFGAAVEAEAVRLEESLIAPCCWNQTLAVHRSPTVDEMKLEIREQLAAGQTHDEVLDHFERQHGMKVLARPPASGFHRLLYILPPLVLILSVLGLVIYAKRLTARPKAEETSEPANPDEESTETSALRRKLGEELRELD